VESTSSGQRKWSAYGTRWWTPSGSPLVDVFVDEVADWWQVVSPRLLAVSRRRGLAVSRRRGSDHGLWRLSPRLPEFQSPRVTTKEAALAALGAGGLWFGGMGRWDANLGQCWARPARQEWNHRCLQSSGTTGSSGTGTHYPNYPIKLRVI
jgi:hypothetical protein